jgi:hypothetical protein
MQEERRSKKEEMGSRMMETGVYPPRCHSIRSTMVLWDEDDFSVLALFLEMFQGAPSLR